MFKYQIETMEQMYDMCEKLENVTDKRIKLKIGWCRGSFLNTRYEWVEKKGDLYIALNRSRVLLIDDFGFILEEMDKLDEDMYVKLDKDVWLKINEWIDNIYEDNRARRLFHEELNVQLEALNKAL